MLMVGITGINGLIGWHLNCYFQSQAEISVITADRNTFSDNVALNYFVAESDVIIHLAGMNRGDDRNIEATNIELTKKIIAACERTVATPHIIFSSSTHITRDTAYGRSKKACGELFSQWAEKINASFTNLILPHVFGEGGKAFYNSVVSTFCYQLAEGKIPKIINDGVLELLHTQQLAGNIHSIIVNNTTGDTRLDGRLIKVSELLFNLQQFDNMYRHHIVPNLDDELDLALFNTYRSYLIPAHYPVSLELYQDARGGLFEAIKSNNGGQCFISTTKPGVTRGNHYHLRKVERFLVISGNGVIRLRKLFTNKVYEFQVSGDAPQYVDIPTLYTHNITNTGESDMMTLFWANEIFDPENPDTFAEEV